VGSGYVMLEVSTITAEANIFAGAHSHQTPRTHAPIIERQWKEKEEGGWPASMMAMDEIGEPR